MSVQQVNGTEKSVEVEKIINNVSETSVINMNNLKHITLNSGAVLRGFYLLVGLSILVVLYLAYRGLRLRKSRIERRYGTSKSNDTQELTPLPVGNICDEEDSDGEDHTIFELQHLSIKK